jgi:ATP/maltotriose-dependent transcriptional regulator MalT
MRAALDCGPTGQALTELQVLETNITFWMEDFARNILVGEEVLPKLVEGSASWIQVVGHLIMANTQRGRPQQTAALGHRLLGIEPAVDSINAYMEALAFLGAMMQWTGQRGPSQAVLERLEQVVKAGGHARDSFPHGWWCTNRGAFECDLEDRPWHSCQVAQEGVEAFGKVGAERSQLVARTVLGLALAALGELSRAMEVMREGLARARFFDRAGAWLQVNMTQVLASSSVPEHQEEARRLALQTREAERGNPMHVGIVSVSLARVALAQGALAEAEAWTREACELLGPLALYQLSARICLSAALLGQGRVAQSRVEATEGVRLLEQMGGAGVASVEAWLALAEACLAQGDDAAAEEAMRKAVDCLRRKAADLPDAAARERFLRQVPANARVLQLAEQRWETFAL